MGQYDALLQPFTLRHLTLRNRIVSTSHAPAYAEGGMPQGTLSALSRREGQGRHRPHHVRRLLRGLARLPGDLRPARRQRRPDHPPFPRVLRPDPWAGRGADVPDLPYGPAHPLGCRQLAGARRPLARCASRSIAPSPRRWRIGTSPASSAISARRRGAARKAGSTASSSPSRPCIWCRNSGRPAPTSAPTNMAAAWTTACASAWRCWRRCAARSGPISSSASA